MKTIDKDGNIIVSEKNAMYIYSPDDVKELKKSIKIKNCSYCFSLVAMGMLLNYWRQDSNAILSEVVCISSFIISSASNIYGNYISNSVDARCRK